MKPFRSKQKEFTGQFDDVHEERRPRPKHRKFVEEDDEENSWPKHPTDVSDYLDDDEDLYTPSSQT